MDKIPLILLPGTLCNQKMWEFQINELQDVSDCKVMSLNENSIEKMAQSVLKQAPRKFALAGFSMGGNVAIEVIRQAPERVIKLALMNTNPNPPRQDQILGWEKFIKMAKQGDFLKITPMYLLPNMIKPDHYDKKDITSLIIQMADNIGQSNMINQMTALIDRPDGREVLSKITCPTMLLTGRYDVLCNVDLHEKMKKQIFKSTLVVIENSGHMTTLEQPKEVSQVLRHWLSES